MQNQLKDKVRRVFKGHRQAVLLLVSVLVVVLVMTTCIGFVQRGNAVRQNVNARNAIADDLYNALYMFCQTFEQTKIPTLDETNYVLPQLREYYYSAEALSGAITKGFGARYTVLDSAMKSSLESAFTAYDEAIAAGEATDRARTLMGDCVTKLRAILERRFVGGELTAA